MPGVLRAWCPVMIYSSCWAAQRTTWFDQDPEPPNLILTSGFQDIRERHTHVLGELAQAKVGACALGTAS